jgi:hypothetical protein
MCLVHSPSAPAAPPPPQYLHNPYLDGAAMGGLASNMGRNSLRTDLGTSGPSGLSTDSTPNSNTGLTLGQPGTVVPTVGGVMAGVMAGRTTQPLPLMARK